MGRLQPEAREECAPTVVVLSDVRLYREGLLQVLNADGRVKVVAVAATVADALRHLDQTVQVVLIDVALDRSMPAITAIRQEVSARIIALGVADSDVDILECAEAGVDAYVARDASLDSLIDTIANAVRGELLCSPRIAATLFKRIAALRSQRSTASSVELMTRREQQVLGLVRCGRSNKEIAWQLNIEVATVKNHVHNILSKLGARRRSELAARTFESYELRD